MPPAARTTDPTDHGGVVGPPTNPKVAAVLIEDLPAAVIGQTYVCPIPPHAANIVAVPAGLPPRVLIGGMPAACMGDQTACGAKIILGALTVLMGG